MNDKLKAAGQNYGKGFTCSQSVFCAYADEMGIAPNTACRIMEGFGGGIGGTQEICGALAAACAVISYYSCDGSYDLEKRQETYRHVCEALDRFRKEYGGVTCKEVLHGAAPKAFQCGMKVKDAVLIIEQIIGKERSIFQSKN
ncbi:MAG: C-GCAxxG-C-C family protein [Oscillospiraceae bacterium]|nr:C-GCAxxG-C-C family protein [Oscillospiraceae bacterium]